MVQKKNPFAKCSNMHILFLDPKIPYFVFASITKWNRSTVKIKLNLYETPTQTETWPSILSVGFILTTIGYICFFFRRREKKPPSSFVHVYFQLNVARIFRDFFFECFSVFMGANKLFLIFCVLLNVLNFTFSNHLSANNLEIIVLECRMWKVN